MRDPAAFLMDEPLSNLDARLRLTMRGEIKRLCQRLGATTLYVTHDQAEALTMADLIAVMSAGELQQLGPPDEIYDRPANRFVATFVGNPPMNVLQRRGRRRRPARRRRHAAARAGAARGLRRRAASTEIGIRPEDLQPRGAGCARRARRARSTSSSRWATRRWSTCASATSGSSVRARRGFTAPIGSTIGVDLRHRDACFFDATGVTVVHRVRNKGG